MIRKRKSLFLMAFIALSAIVASYTLQTYSDREGYRILVEQGPQAAIEYFSQAQATAAGKNDVSIWYGYAWSNFRDRRYGVAEDYCQRILGTNPDMRRRADVHYLLGFIFLETGRHFMANLRFKDAIELYDKVENGEPNIYRSYLGLARVYMAGNNFDETSRALDLAIRHGGQIKSLAEYYVLKTELAFKMNDYKLALKYSRISLDDAVGDDPASTAAHINIAFYSLLLGDLEGALANNQIASRLILKNNFTNYHPFSRLNLLLYKRCAGEDYQVLVDEIEASIIANHDNNLKSLLDFVLKWECSSYEL